MGKKGKKEQSVRESRQKTRPPTLGAPGKHVLKKFMQEEQITFARIKELVNLLKAKYKISTKDIIHLTDEEEILIPFSIFTKRLSVLETITKYLKEELELSYHQIGMVLNRNEKNIWHTYKNATKKLSGKLRSIPAKYFFPVSIFQNKLSVLENIVLYAKDELHLSYHAIAVLLERNDRTIWMMYQRAKKKST